MSTLALAHPTPCCLPNAPDTLVCLRLTSTKSRIRLCSSLHLLEQCITQMVKNYLLNKWMNESTPGASSITQMPSTPFSCPDSPEFQAPSANYLSVLKFSYAQNGTQIFFIPSKLSFFLEIPSLGPYLSYDTWNSFWTLLTFHSKTLSMGTSFGRPSSYPSLAAPHTPACSDPDHAVSTLRCCLFTKASLIQSFTFQDLKVMFDTDAKKTS